MAQTAWFATYIYNKRKIWKKIHKYTRYIGWFNLVASDSGKRLVFDQRTFPVLRSICSWRVTTYVGKPFAI